MSVIDIGGVQGAGKSTLIEHAQELTHHNFEVVKRSVILAQILGVKIGNENNVEPDKFQLARSEMQAIVASKDRCVRDVHFSRYFPEPEIYPVDDSDYGRISAVVLVHSSLETLIERRRSSERRRPVDPDVISRQVGLEEEGAHYAANALQVPMIKIANENLLLAAYTLAEVINEYL